MERTASIVYFGTSGSLGHKPIGIDAELTNEEYEYYCGIDCDEWINYIYLHPGYQQLKDENEVATFALIAYPWSVDDKRGCSHTNLIWWGEHSEEDMFALIQSNDFLTKQFSPVLQS